MLTRRPAPQLLYVPQFGIHSPGLLPYPWQLPHGDARTLGFNFPETPILGTSALDMRIEEDLVVYAIHAVLGTDEEFVQPAVAMMFYHTHNGAKRWLDLQHTQYDAIAGTAANPKYLKAPLYLEKGDTLTCEIANGAIGFSHGAIGSVTIDTPGAGMTPGGYAAIITGGGGAGGAVHITVNPDGTVHAGGATVTFGGSYTGVPTITAPPAAGGAPAATFTADMVPIGYGNQNYIGVDFYVALDAVAPDVPTAPAEGR